MSGEMGCEQVRELSPELALDIAGGEERDAALRHLSVCPSCRELVSELSLVSDQLLRLAPSHEPPVGFETRVLAGLAERPRQRKRWKAVLAAAAAVIVIAAISVGTVLHATSTDRRVGASYRALLGRAQGSFFAVAALQSSGTGVGAAFGYQGHPSWIYVTLQGPTGAPGHYDVQLVTRSGQRFDLGQAVLGGSHDTWGSPIPIDLTRVRWLEFRKGSGPPVLVARFDAQSPWSSG